MGTQDRQLLDANLIVTTALPAAAASNNSASIDLEQARLGVTTEGFEVEISVPALPALVDDKTVTITLQDSADNSSFAAIPQLATLVITGAGGAGADATSRRVRLPGSTRQYIRINQAVLTAGGNNTAVSTTLQLVF